MLSCCCFTSNTTVKQLLTKGHTKVLKGFKSRRTNKKFEAALKLNPKGRVEFDFTDVSWETPEPKKQTKPRSKKQPALPPSAMPNLPPTSPVGMKCPTCKQGSLIKGRTAWGCNRWREGCKFVFSFVNENQQISPQEAVHLINKLRK